jgi:hypothetical protein
MEIHGVGVYFCYPCKAEYCQFWQSTVFANISLYTEINQEMYRWSVSSTGDAQLWYVGEPGEPGIRANKKLESIKYFRTETVNVPTITPLNINEKIRTWLLLL